MGIRTRSMRHASGSALQVPDAPEKVSPKKPKQRRLQQRKLTEFEATKIKTETPPSPPPTPTLTPKKQTRPCRRSATITTDITTSTTTTAVASSPVTTKSQLPKRPQLTTAQSLPAMSKEHEHTMRYIQQAKVPFLNRWLEAQSSAKHLLNPMTPDYRTKQRPHTERMKTRAERSGIKVDWRHSIDAMSVAPAPQAKGTFKNLSSGSRNPQTELQKPP